MTRQEAETQYPLGEVFKQIDNERMVLTQTEWAQFIDNVVNPPTPIIEPE